MAGERIKTIHDSPSQEHVESVPTLKRSEVVQEFADYEDEMLALEDLMIKMKHKRYTLLQKLNSASPWSIILPLDITTEIFSLVCDSQDIINYGELPAPFILGRICRAWRTVVWSTPRLWSILKIRFTQTKFPHQEGLLKEWILRSGSYPLHVYLDAVLTSAWEPTEAFFDSLLESSSRWKSLDTFVFHGLSRAIRGEGDKSWHSFPCLQNIRLHGDRSDSAPSVDYMKFFFHRTDKLRSFRDQGACTGYGFGAKWAQLEDLELTLGPSLYLPLFQFVRDLQTIRLRLIAGRGGWTSPVVKLPLAVPKLKHLSIEALSTDISQCLHAITTPNLTSLVVTVMSGSANTNWLQSILDIQVQSSCRLTSLTIKDGHVASEAESVALLDSLPMLERLSLDSLQNFSFSDFTINKLDPSKQTAEANPFLPNLKELKYRGDIEFLPTSLATMLKERLLSSQKDSSDDVPSIEALRNMDITYWNREWGHSDGSNPNILRDFHQQIASLSSLGLTLSIAWEYTEDEE